jgi:hypothetical protein
MTGFYQSLEVAKIVKRKVLTVDTIFHILASFTTTLPLNRDGHLLLQLAGISVVPGQDQRGEVGLPASYIVHMLIVNLLEQDDTQPQISIHVAPLPPSSTQKRIK